MKKNLLPPSGSQTSSLSAPAKSAPFIASAGAYIDPAALYMLAAIDKHGSMAAAARHLGLVPSALTYRMRQLEEQLDALLLDRSGRNALLTPAGKELLLRGEQLMQEMSALIKRVKRVASGWEPSLTLAVDSIVARAPLLDLVERFYATGAPTQLRLRSEVMQGGWEALQTGAADLALGIGVPDSYGKDYATQILGPIEMVFAVAPHHPLAQAPEPLSDALIAQYRAIAVADSSTQGRGLTIGLLDGQDTLTVPTMNSKIEAQLRGLGCGFVPACQVRGYLESGRMIQKAVQRQRRITTLYCSWRTPPRGPLGQALAWWVDALAQAKTQEALLNQTGGGL